MPPTVRSASKGFRGDPHKSSKQAEAATFVAAKTWGFNTGAEHRREHNLKMSHCALIRKFLRQIKSERPYNDDKGSDKSEKRNKDVEKSHQERKYLRLQPRTTNSKGINDQCFLVKDREDGDNIRLKK